MKHYVVGFLFVEDNTKCLMVKKNKPDFMRGFWNGIGGEIESEDLTTHHAMCREYFEETGIHVDWIPFAILYRPSATITCFWASHREMEKVAKVNDVGEELSWLMWRFASPLYKNAPMLMELALLDPENTVEIYLGDHD